MPNEFKNIFILLVKRDEEVINKFLENFNKN